MIHFKSFKLKIIVLCGLCLLMTAGSILIYDLIAARKNKNFVQTSLQTVFTETARQQLTASARAIGFKIKAEMEAALDTARTMANVFGGTKAKTINLKIDRDRANSILRSLLVKNKKFVSIYTAWEPNAFDNLDELYAGSQGHDHSGRFIPYWSRSKGKITLAPLQDYANIKCLQESVIDPHPNKQGEQIISMKVPLIVNEHFYGIVGIDQSTKFLQTMVEALNQNLYKGKGQTAVITYNGLIAASSKQKTVNQKRPDLLKLIQKGQTHINTDHQTFQVQIPLIIGTTKTPWAVVIEVPAKAVLLQVNQFVTKLDQRIEQNFVRTIIAGTGVLVLGLLLLWIMAARMVSPIKKSVSLANAIAQGDLSQRLASNLKDEIGALVRALNAMVVRIEQKACVAKSIGARDLTVKVEIQSKEDVMGNALDKMLTDLKEVITQVYAISSQVAGGADQVAQASQELSQGANQQAASLEEITSSMTEIGSQIEINAETASTVNQLAVETREIAEAGKMKMMDMNKAMRAIREAGQAIASINKIIDEIAFQTNLLALNAAVEAARAGKHGKGFAVVAEEVRNLAGRSARASKETAGLIESLNEKVSMGELAAERTSSSLDNIVSSVKNMAVFVKKIDEACSEQTQGINQINEGLGQIEQVTQQNTANSQETASAAEELASQVEMLKQIMSRFKLDRKNPEPIHPPKSNSDWTSIPLEDFEISDDDFENY